MALTNTTTLPHAPYPNVPYSIYQEWCMGDSLAVINANFDYFNSTDIALQTKILSLSADLTTVKASLATNSSGTGSSGTGTLSVVTPATITPKVVGLVDQTLGGGNTQGNMYIISDGTMRVVGKSSSGELGIGSDTSSTTTPRIPLFEPPLFTGEGIANITPQGDVTYVITTFGRLYGAGSNANYQLGQGDAVNRYVFTRIYLEPTGSSTIDAATPKTSAYFVKKIVPGSGGTSVNITVFALTDNGDVYMWGYQGAGFIPGPQIPTAAGAANANYIFKPVKCTTISSVKDIVSGGNSGVQTTFFHKTDNTLWVCGENSLGCAGIGNLYVAAPNNIPVYGDIKNKVLQVTTPNTSITSGGSTFAIPGIGNNVKRIYCGGEASYITSWVITTTGHVHGAGYNNVGQATNATTPGNKVSIFTSLNELIKAGDDVEQLFGHSDSAQTTMFALIKTSTPNGYKIKGWGTNTMGTLGIGNNTSVILLPTITNAPWIATGAEVAQLCVAGDNTNTTTLVLDTKGRLWSTGFGDNGLLGNGKIGATSRRNNFELVSISPGYGIPKQIRATNTSFAGWSNFLVLMDTGKVLGWGYDHVSSGQLAVDPSSKPTSIPSFVQLLA